MNDIKNKIEEKIMGIAGSIKSIECPCCGEITSDSKAENDPDNDERDIVTCEINGCVFYLTTYSDGTIFSEECFD